MKVGGHLKVFNDIDLNKGLLKRAENPSPFYITKSITIESPTDSEDITFFFATENLSVANVHGVLRGTGSPSVEFYIKHDLDRTAIGESVLGDGFYLNAVTTAQPATPTETGKAIAKDSWVWVETTQSNGTVNEMTVSVRLTEEE